MKKKFTSFFNIKSWMNKQSPWLFILITIFLQAIFFFFITLNNVYTETHDVERFANASATIRSPITIENEQETERKVRESVQQVEDRYTISQQVINESISMSEEIFDAVLTFNEEVQTNPTQAEDEEGNQELEEELSMLSNEEKIDHLRQILSEEIVQEANVEDMLVLLEAPEQEIEESSEIFTDSVQRVMENGVRTENLQTAKTLVQEDLMHSSLDAEVIDVLVNFTDFIIMENSFFDLDETNEARKAAASNVDQEMINAGEIIVSEGQIITNEIYESLNLVGLLNGQRNFYPIFGLVILILLLSGVIGFELNKIARKEGNKRIIIAILFISIIVVGLMKVISLYSTDSNQLFYMMPIAMAALLLKTLINERITVLMAAVYAILGSVIFNGLIPGALNIEALIYFFLSQLAAIMVIDQIKDRLAILRSGMGITIVNISVVLLFLFLSFEKYSLVDFFTQSIFAVTSAFLAAVLTIGLLPFFETGLGILSDARLLQLSSPNQPLLKKLLVEAPGTYHHSVMVANISETACEAISANGLMARVGAYYHDIGKTVRPQFFIENQMGGQNPHDYIEPQKSADIILSHPYDGVEMLRKEKVPREIIEIAQTHHGTSLLKFFYFKEKESNPDVKESDYRYPGPKPMTKETAVISICDSVEAAVRSMNKPTEEKIEEIVSSIMNNRIADGQLDESPLTLIELKIIQKTICESLNGIFHSRIQYPKKEAK